MSTDLAVLTSLIGLKYLFDKTKAPSVDAQFASMLRKNLSLKKRLNIQIEKLDRSLSDDDAITQHRVERLVDLLDRFIDGLQYIHMRMQNGSAGVAAQYFQDTFWPLTVTLSTHYELQTGKCGDWLHDTNKLFMLCANRGQSLRQPTAQKVRDFATAFLPQVKPAQLTNDGKYCADCGEPMAPCKDCGAWIKPCFLKISMRHICNSAATHGGNSLN